MRDQDFDLRNASVLITGGTGSFGKKFTEVLLREYSPKRVVVFSRDELKQHEMRLSGFDNPCMRYFIGDVRDRDRLRRAMQGVDVVVHAAALKHVPVCEYNPFEAIATNVTGAQNIIEAALDCGVKRVIALSTDKAVNPVNLYGATKLCSDKLFVQGNTYASGKDVRFACVRYGNVVGSRGSVIPLFLKQRSSGTVTVTDERMTRFWITLEQGVRFVLQCIQRMRGGEIFVPKIPSMSIMDLVSVIAPNCTVETIGIRPGEKLHEVLISSDEARLSLEFDDMFLVQPSYPWWNPSLDLGGKPLGEEFCYSSDNNADWLTAADLQRMVEELTSDVGESGVK